MTPLRACILEQLEITEGDLEDFTTSNPGMSGLDLSRMSTLLVAQLTAVRKYRIINSFSVTDVLQVLEGVNPDRGTPKPCGFLGPELQGLWKVHFVDARFLAQNIANEWGQFNANNKKLNRLVKAVVATEQAEPSAHGRQGRLAHELVIGGYERRAEKGKLTGEWIVFGKQQDKNVYLAICAHTKGSDQDLALYNWLRQFCGAEFPGLFERASRADG